MVTGIKPPSQSPILPGEFNLPKEIVDQIGLDTLNSMMALPFSDFKGLLADALRKPAIDSGLYNNTGAGGGKPAIDSGLYNNTGAGGGSLSGGTFTMVYTDDMMTKDFSPAEKDELKQVKDTMTNVYQKAVLKALGVERIQMDGLIIAGGIFTSLLTNDKIKDIDVFVLDNPTLKSFIRPHIQLYRKGDTSYLGNSMIEDTFLEPGSQYPIQFIFTKYRSREELVNHFDYKHCVVSYDIKFDTMLISPYTYDCIKNKKLIVNNGSNLQKWREAKFLKRGFVKVAA